MGGREGYVEGTVPLHTLRADIDFGFSEANTTYGKIGVKVLVYRGDIIKGLNKDAGMPGLAASLPAGQAGAVQFSGKKDEALVQAVPTEKIVAEIPNVTPDA